MPVNEALLREALQGLPEPRLLPEAGSTNLLALELARKGAPDGTAVLADRQTAGRGRRGRSFFSPAGGIYLSVLLRPALSPEERLLLTPMAAVAVCEAVERLCGVSPEVKWVNDLFFRGKKICGILCEGTEDAVVVGIGLNAEAPEGGFPPELAEIAGAVCPFGELPVPKECLAAAICRTVVEESRHFDRESVLRRYRARSFLPGREVTVHPIGGEPYDARALFIDDHARLAVETAAGERLFLSSGEVSVRER